jgi:hypothetical protein
MLGLSERGISMEMLMSKVGLKKDTGNSIHRRFL